MVGGKGLQQRPARPVGAARPAGHLGEELIGALTGPQVAASERKVRVDHPHQGELGEIVPLRCRLGGDHDVDLACLHLLDHLPRGVGMGDGVGGEHRQPRLGKQLGDLLGHPLHARADRGQGVLGAAMGAAFGLGH